MNIYIDFDDCLCEKARHFSELVKGLFGIDVPYESIRYFDLQKSFSLTDEKFEVMMIKAHSSEVLLSYEETDYAIEDSPSAFRFFEHLPKLKVMVYDRPWNRECKFPGENYHRCFDWETIRSLIP